MDISLKQNNNLILNEELKRIHDIMGLKPLILLESGGTIRLVSNLSGEIAESIVNRLKQVINDAGNVTNNILVAGQKFKKDDILRAIRAMESDVPGEAYRNINGNAQKIIRLVLSENTDASNLAYYELIKHLKGKGGYKSEEELLKDILKTIERSPSSEPDEVFIRKFKDEWKELVEIALPTFKRQYDDMIYANGARFTPIINKVGDKPTGGEVLTDDQLKTMRKALRKKSPRKFNTDYFRVFFRSVEKSKAKIKELADGYYTKISETDLKPEEIQQISEEYSVAIVRALNILEARENNAAKTALKNSGIDESIIKIIDENPSEFFKLYREIWGERQASTFTQEIVETTKTFVSDVKNILKTSDIEGKYKVIRKFFSLFNPREKFGQFLLTDTFAVYDRQWQQLIKQSGWQKGNKATYIASMWYLNSVGYIVGSAVADLLQILFGDMLLYYNLNRFLPLDIGWPGYDPWFTIPKFDTEQSMKWLDEFGWNPVGIAFAFLERQLGDVVDYFEEEGVLGGAFKTFVMLVKRGAPMGIFTTTSSTDAKLIEALTPIDFDGGADKIIETVQKGLMQLFNMLPEAEVQAKYEDNKSDFKNWFKAVNPDMVDDVRSYRRIDSDEPDVYYLVNMKGTQSTDYYYKYDENNKTFKEYE